MSSQGTTAMAGNKPAHLCDCGKPNPSRLKEKENYCRDNEPDKWALRYPRLCVILSLLLKCEDSTSLSLICLLVLVSPPYLKYQSRVCRPCAMRIFRVGRAGEPAWLEQGTPLNHFQKLPLPSPSQSHAGCHLLIESPRNKRVLVH